MDKSKDLKDNIHYTPKIIEFFKKINVKLISCGDNHTLVYGKKTKNGKEL